MTDIVERLQKVWVNGSLCSEAADEIERLRCNLTWAEEELRYMRLCAAKPVTHQRSAPNMVRSAPSSDFSTTESSTTGKLYPPLDGRTWP